MVLLLLEVRPKVSKRANRRNMRSSRGIESCAGESPAAESRGAGDWGTKEVAWEGQIDSGSHRNNTWLTH